eukprot:TRINITY_DN5073_c0_g1_i1.p1 TRINITY_DN5073_c0_g1~~TRINITY_DN5073_c0_g1_i1.p1  ORF type:complete len:623 (+),score=172.56 TRINITY_DN5073_c0_g1_i1:48-1916(+)
MAVAVSSKEGGLVSRKRKLEDSPKGDNTQKKFKNTESPEKVNKKKNKKKNDTKQQGSDGKTKTVKPNKANEIKSKGSFKKDKGDKSKKNSANAVPEKIDHAKAKELRLARRKQKKDATIYEVGLKAKKLWEAFRPEECTVQKRKKLLSELTSVIEGKIVKLCLAHDTVRVIESLLLHGDATQRAAVFKEVVESFLLMAKSKFGSFIALKMLKYGSKEQREAIANQIDGQTAKLMKHKVANAVVELYYNDHANAARRNRMLQDFCGPEFTKFKDPEIRTAKDLMEKYPEKEKDIYKNLHENVCTLITKGCYNHSLVHTVIYNFMSVAKEKERSEIISQLREACVHIMHSAHGAKTSMLCVWYGNNKDRKAIIKNFKTFVPKIATEEHGHLVLLAIFDAMDDTKFVGKTILAEIKSNFGEIVRNKYGKKVIQYLLAPRSTVLFHPDVVSKLKIGDGNPYSKKDAKLRAEELLGEIAPTIVDYLRDNAEDLLTEGEGIFIVAVINQAPGDLKASMEALGAAILKDNDLVEQPGCHKMLKKIVQADKDRYKAERPIFSEILVGGASLENLDAWLRCNRGAFLLVALFETEIPKIRELIVEKLKMLKPTLSTQKTSGIECLKSKLGL